MKKNLYFEATIFRDWSVAYCQMAQISAVKEFKKQFGWSYSDLLFEWDGKNETLYRANEEHIHGMYNFVTNKIKNDINFISKISISLLKDIKNYQILLENWLKLDFNDYDNEFVSKIFLTLNKEYIPLLPRFLIIMYFPQQLEQHYQIYKAQYQKENDICINTRAQVDKILAPLTEELLRKIGEYSLKITNIDNKKQFGRFLTIKEIENLLSNNYLKKEISLYDELLKKRSKHFLIADGDINFLSIRDYLKNKSWEIVEHKVIDNAKYIKGKSTIEFLNNIIGKVKIVQNKTELFKIEEGDIIVAPMTTPEYALVYKKIIAIITDEGGITCHAAIISRELKIPAIVGTKVATKIFKDNDIVEINTKTGEVKLSEK